MPITCIQCHNQTVNLVSGYSSLQVSAFTENKFNIINWINSYTTHSCIFLVFECSCTLVQRVEKLQYTNITKKKEKKKITGKGDYANLEFSNY